LDGVEPPHVNVRKERKEAKFWLDEVRLARNQRDTDKEIGEIATVVRRHRSPFLEKWHEHLATWR
jgi:hypothetical protein